MIHLESEFELYVESDDPKNHYRGKGYSVVQKHKMLKNKWNNWGFFTADSICNKDLKHRI